MSAVEVLNPGTTDLCKAIVEGEFESADLARIKNAIASREALLLREMRAELAVGDRVKLTATCRPKYLLGHTATITKVRTSGRELVIDFGRRIGRYGPVTEVERSMVEPV